MNIRAVTDITCRSEHSHPKKKGWPVSHPVMENGDFYGPTPPVWQSAQFTAVMSPRSTGWVNFAPVVVAISCLPLSVCASIVWQTLQSLLMTLPSALT